MGGRAGRAAPTPPLAPPRPSRPSFREEIAHLPLEEQVEHLVFALEQITTLPAAVSRLLLERGISLRPQEGAILFALHRRMPSPISYDGLIAVVSWRRVPDSWAQQKMVNVIVCRLNAKLAEKRMGFRIRNVRGFGYFMEQVRE
jgi:DNA-binding response OmpR family regulator